LLKLLSQLQCSLSRIVSHIKSVIQIVCRLNAVKKISDFFRVAISIHMQVIENFDLWHVVPLICCTIIHPYSNYESDFLLHDCSLVPKYIIWRKIWIRADVNLKSKPSNTFYSVWFSLFIGDTENTMLVFDITKYIS
jgi:hypothetical protein